MLIINAYRTTKTEQDQIIVVIAYLETKNKYVKMKSSTR